MALDKEKIREDAQLFIKESQWDKALVEYQKLKVLEAGLPDVHADIAIVYQNLNETDKAAQEFARAGRLFEKANDKEQAIRMYENALQLKSDQKDILKAISILRESRIKAPLIKTAEAKKVNIEGETAKKDTGRSLLSIPLFSDLDESEFNELIRVSKKRSFVKNEVIVEEGSPGDSIFFIVSGEVGIFKKGYRGEPLWLNTLSDGDFFGELAYFSKTVRQASVIATVETEIIEMGRSELESVCELFPKITESLIEFYKMRVLDTIVAIVPIFKSLQPQQRRKLISRFELNVITAGNIIIEEKKQGSALYLIKDGTVNVITKAYDGRDVLLSQLKEGDFFGEVSLFMMVPATASVVAENDVRLMKLSQENFKWMLDEYPFLRRTLKDHIEKRAESAIGSIMLFYEHENDTVKI